MPEEKFQSDLSLIKEFFGYKPGDRLSDFAEEFKSLSDMEKILLAEGIRDGSLNY